VKQEHIAERDMVRRMTFRTQQMGWFLVMGTAAIFVIFYMSMYQIERDKWSRMMREIPIIPTQKSKFLYNSLNLEKNNKSTKIKSL
jgi:type II secretory pathway component PulF